MAVAKALLPNQHMPLHFLYGRHDCCLCNRDQEIASLRDEVKMLRLRLELKEQAQEPQFRLGKTRRFEEVPQ